MTSSNKQLAILIYYQFVILGLEDLEANWFENFPLHYIDASLTWED